MRRVNGGRWVLAAVVVAAAGWAAEGEELKDGSTTMIAAAATQSVDPAVQAKVDALVGKLGSESFKERDAASKALGEMGAEAVGAIKHAAEAVTDPESKSRLGQIVQDIGDAEAIRPTLVSLDVKDATLKTVFGELSKQTGLTIAGWPDWSFGGQHDAATITLKVEKAPFWVAMGEVSKQRPMVSMGGGGDDEMLRFNVGGGSAVRPPTVVSGPFVISATGILRSYQATLHEAAAENTVDRQFSVSLECLVDPKVKVPENYISIALNRAVDDKDNELLAGGGVRQENQRIWNYRVNASLPLKYPEKPGTKIVRISGKISANVSLGADMLEFKEFKAGGSGMAGGMKFTFQGMTEDAGGCEVKLKVERNDVPPERFRKIRDGGSSYMEIDLLDDKGVAMRKSGGGGMGSENMFEYAYRFSARDTEMKKAGKPALLRVSVVTRTKVIEMPFEFKDLPLP